MEATSNPNITTNVFRDLGIPRIVPGIEYAVPRSADKSGLLDCLTPKLEQLKAMLFMTYGESGASFRGAIDDIQDNYMWACALLADECAALLRCATEQDDHQ